MKDHEAFIDELLSRLEAEWKERGDANLRKLVPEVGHPHRRLALVTLIPVDQEYRWQSDDKKKVEGYLEEWPELGEDDKAVVELVEAECVTRADLGDLPSADEIHTRFPKLIGLIDLGKLASGQKPTRNQVVHPQDSSSEAEPADETDLFSTTHIEKVGENIGHYHLLTVLGEGGFGTVYLAEQQRPVKRRVALKVIKPGMDSRQVIARFEAERQALAMMDHPNIAKVFDAGVTDTGRPYFVMELVQGEPITSYCDRHRLTIDERLDLFVPICEAIQHAHQKGIIHRDIKPSNVLVTIRDDSAVPKIIDFGIAKAMAQPLTERTLYTEQGQLIGTPAYMSPEQAEMTGLDIDTRSDVYSLGVLLYELLTGALPFDNASLRQAGLMGIAKVIREEEPPKPSTKISTLGDESENLAQRRRLSRDTLRRRLRGDLDWIVMKTLEKDRRRRYSTALDLAEDITRYQKHEAVDAAPPGLVYRTRKRLWKYRLWYGVSAVVGLVLLGGIIASTHFALRARENAEETLAALGTVQMEKRRADNERDSARKQEEVAREQRRLALAAQISAEDARQREQTVHQEMEWLAYRSTIGLLGYKWQAGGFQTVDETLDDLPETHRNWEWGYLKRLCHQELLSYETPGSVPGMALSPDDQHIAFATGSRRNVAVLDLMSPDRLRVFPTDSSWVESVAWSPDGERIAAVDGNVVRLWRFEDGALLHCLRGHHEKVWDVTFSPDGRRLATASYDHTVRIWDSASGQQVTVLEGHDAGVTSVCFSADGKRIVSGSYDETIKLWDLADNSKAVTLRPHAGSVLSVAFSPDGTKIASGCRDGVVVVWNAENGSELFRYPASTSATWCVTFSPDCNRIASSGTDGRITLYDTQANNIVRNIVGHRSDVRDLNFSSDGNRIVSGSLDATIRIWDATVDARSRLVNGSEKATKTLAMSPDGQMIALGEQDGSIVLRSPTTNLVIKTLRCNSPLECLAFSNDSRMLAVGLADRVVVWQLDTFEETISFSTDGNPPSALVFSRDGTRVAGGFFSSAPAAVKIWSITEGRVVLGISRGAKLHTNDIVFTRNPECVVSSCAGCPHIQVYSAITGEQLHAFEQLAGVVCLALSPDGNWLASGGQNSELAIWDVLNWKRIRTLRGHYGSIRCLTFSPDGSRIFSGGDDKSIRVWDFATGEEILALRGHDDSVTALSVSLDGLVVTSASRDGTAKLWKATPWSTGRSMAEMNPNELRRFTGHAGPVRAVDVSPDGTLVASVSGHPNGDGTLRIWDRHTGEALHILRAADHTVMCVAFTPDGQRVISGGQLVRVWAVKSGELLREIEIGTTVQSSVALADNRRVILGDSAASVTAWNIDTGKLVRKYGGITTGGRQVDLELSADGQRVISADDKGAFHVWDVETAEEIAHVIDLDSSVRSATLDVDGSHAAIGMDDANLMVYALADLASPIATIDTSNAVDCIRYSPDGNLLMTARSDRKIRIWDARLRELKTTFTGHGQRVWAAVFTPDGKNVVSGGGSEWQDGEYTPCTDATVRLWKVPESILGDQAV